MIILSIESSCDETACAIVENGLNEISSTIASSKDFHIKTGGVVPEVAARKQLEFILKVVQDCIDKSSLTLNDIDAIAVTVGPGLVGSLLIGIEFAKSLSLALNKPLIPVNHLIGHIFSGLLEKDLSYEDISKLFPAIGFVVSGGHTDLILVKDFNSYEFIGGTLDDAAGEAFDKTARLLGLSSYLGAVELSNLAATCTNNNMMGVLPRPMINANNYDFSFSGLKTAVKNVINKNQYDKNVIACEFENAVCDVCLTKCLKAANDYNARSIFLGGGVSANTQLRNRFIIESLANGYDLFIPSLRLTGDNAVYIATAAYFSIKGDLKNIQTKEFKDIGAMPNLGVTSLV